MNKNKQLKKIHAVDLFCGIGGLTHGLGLSGIKVKAGFDIDSSCEFVYKANNSGTDFIGADIRDIRFNDIEKYFKDADITVLAGCSPCQPFSSLTRRMKSAQVDNCSLVGEFTRLVEEGTPDFVSMENVPGLAKHEAFDKFLSMLDALDYKYSHDTLSCADYGVPQNRKRLVLLASRLGEISLPKPTRGKMTVGDFIRSLPEIEDGQVSSDDPVHVTLQLSAKNRQRIRQSKPGGSWKDWDNDIINQCHKKSYYPAPYGRMRWDAPAPTITTQFCYYSTGRFGHPQQHRAISVREAAMLQTFPDRYKLIEDGKPLVIHEMARHIGNAVPVKLAEAIGKSIIESANVQ